MFESLNLMKPITKAQLFQITEKLFKNQNFGEEVVCKDVAYNNSRNKLYEPINNNIL